MCRCADRISDLDYNSVIKNIQKNGGINIQNWFKAILVLCIPGTGPVTHLLFLNTSDGRLPETKTVDPPSPVPAAESVESAAELTQLRTWFRQGANNLSSVAEGTDENTARKTLSNLFWRPGGLQSASAVRGGRSLALWLALGLRLPSLSHHTILKK